MTYIGTARNKISDFVVKVKDKAHTNIEKNESDVDSDSHVASSRAATLDDGNYVGRTGPDVALDVGQSGAEARSEQNRHSP